MSPEVPVAGQRFSLICHVRSDLPATPSWRRPSGSVTAADRVTTLVSLEFDPLLMSHSGEYECLSEIDSNFPDNTSSKVIQLQVEGRPKNNVASCDLVITLRKGIDSVF